MKRRAFVQWGMAIGAAASKAATLLAQAPAIRTGRVLSFYIINKQGGYAGVAMYPAKYAVCTEYGAQTLDVEPLFTGSPNA